MKSGPGKLEEEEEILLSGEKEVQALGQERSEMGEGGQPDGRND